MRRGSQSNNDPEFCQPGSRIRYAEKFREPCFQNSFVKIPSYNKCTLRISGFQFTWSPMKFFQGCRCVCLGGIYTAVIYNRREFSWQIILMHLIVRKSRSGEQKDLSSCMLLQLEHESLIMKRPSSSWRDVYSCRRDAQRIQVAVPTPDSKS